jgi:hypothetical protein
MAFALFALSIPAWRAGRRRQALAVPIGLGLFVVPLYAWQVVNTQVLHRSGATTTGGYHPPATDRLHYLGAVASYTWQAFLPRLPFMQDQYQNTFHTNPPFPAFPQYPLWQTWVQGFVGRFGWHQENFPDWVNIPAAIVFAVIGFLALRAVWRATGRLRARRAEVVTYVLMAVGAFMLITVAGYGWRVSRGGLSFEQARYLLPLLPLYAGVAACAAVGIRRRWGAALAGILVVLAIAHSLGAIILVLGRYYG